VTARRLTGSAAAAESASAHVPLGARSALQSGAPAPACPTSAAATSAAATVTHANLTDAV